MQKTLFLISILLLINCAHKPVAQHQNEFTSVATKYVQEFQKDCTPHSDVWGKSLCVPLIILDRGSLTAVSSHGDPKKQFKHVNNVYVGTYYGNPVYANTSFEWDSMKWSMVLWPLSDALNDRKRLLFHEAFHSVQESLGFKMTNSVNDHLDQESARVLLRLEWAALLKSMEDNKYSKLHLAVAVQLREERFKKYKDAKEKERALDISEGLAEYTGTKLQGLSQDETIKYFEHRLSKLTEVPSLIRSSAYYSGPLYGYVLDSCNANWKQGLYHEKDFGKLIIKYCGISRSKSKEKLNLANLTDYGFNEISSFEKQRALILKNKIKIYLGKFEQEGRIEVELKSPQAIFNPYGILSVNANKKIYETFEVTDEWGHFVANAGALVLSNKEKRTVVLSPPTVRSIDEASGDGWTLKLKSGYQFRKLNNKVLIERIR